MADRLTLNDLAALPDKTRRATSEDMSVGEQALDVAKSAGIGVAQGAIGLVTLPANLADLGAQAVDFLGDQVGANPGLSEYTKNLPTYQNTKQAIEGLTGEFYEPQTVLGKYARTVGEFAPGAGVMGGLSRAARVTNAVVPGVASEAAGQLTEGTEWEPAARLAGALTGGMLPTMAMRAVTPMRIDQARANAVRTLEGEGVTSLTAGDRTGNRALRWMESVSQDMPFSGGRAGAIKDAQSREFSRAALRRAGINADEATPAVLDGAFTRLSNQFENLTQNNAIRVDSQLFNDLRTAWQQYASETAPTLRAPVIENVISDIINAAQNPARNGLFAGPAYATTRKRLAEIERSSRFTKPELASATRQIRESLDDAMERSVPQQVADDWRMAREQYRELLAIENAVGKTGQAAAGGQITPAALGRSVINQDKRAYVRGQRDQGELARAGQEILTPLPQSGTAPRQNAQNFLNALGALGGGWAGGGPGALAGMVGQAGLQGGMARTLMSRPMQNYLSNQLLANAIDQYGAQLAPRFAVTAPQAAAMATVPPDQFVLVGSSP